MPVDIRHVVEAMADDLAPTTVRTNYSVLRAILSAAVDADVLAVNPCRGVKLPAHARKEIRFLSADELERLADEMPDEYRPMIHLAGVLGLRWSEVAGLRVGRIDFLRRTLEITETCAEVNGKLMFAPVKTKASRRTLNMPQFVVHMLSEHLAARGRPEPDGLVFVAPEGGPPRRSNFRLRVFDPAVSAPGSTGSRSTVSAIPPRACSSRPVRTSRRSSSASATPRSGSRATSTARSCPPSTKQ
jgi:integrase